MSGLRLIKIARTKRKNDEDLEVSKKSQTTREEVRALRPVRNIEPDSTINLKEPSVADATWKEVAR